MKECAVCNEIALHKCIPCQIFLCDEHKSLHKTSKKGEHLFDYLGILLTSEEKEKALNTLSMKVGLAVECQARIIEQTKTIISIIQKLCANTIAILIKKQKQYEYLFELCQKRLSPDQKEEIQLQLNIPNWIDIPTPDLKHLHNFYNFDFLKESMHIKAIPSLNIPDALIILAQDCNLHIEGHRRAVTCLAVTPDNKYVISGSEDHSIRICNIQEKVDEVLLGHTSAVTKLLVTSDCRYVVSASKDKTIRIWNLLEKKTITSTAGEYWEYTCFSYNKR